MTNGNTQARRRDAEERARKIRAAEEAAQRAHAKALARVEAEGLWAGVEAADAARIEAELHVTALRDELVRHFRAYVGRLAEPWPHSEALRAAEEASRELEAAFEAAFEKYIRVMNADEFTFRRVLILKADALDESRAAHGRGGRARGAQVKAEAEQLRDFAAREAEKVRAKEPKARLQDLADRIGVDRKTLMVPDRKSRRRPVR